MSRDLLPKLKERFEGKTVISVDPPEAREAIAKFTMSDGTAFRLHATDLGYWMEETVPSDGRYRGFDGLFGDYGHHHYDLQPQFDFDAPEPTVTVEGGTLRIVAADGRVFEGGLSQFTPWERSVCEHSEGAKLLARASVMGDMWKMEFCRRDWEDIDPEYQCPVELRIPWREE